MVSHGFLNSCFEATIFDFDNKPEQNKEAQILDIEGFEPFACHKPTWSLKPQLPHLSNRYLTTPEWKITQDALTGSSLMNKSDTGDFKSCHYRTSSRDFTTV